MVHRERPRASTRLARSAILVLIAVAVASAIAVLGYQLSTPPDVGAHSAEAGDKPRRPPSPPGGSPLGDRGGALGRADGAVSGEVTVFDSVPAVARLDPALLTALRTAARDARRDGVTFHVNSGWRSARYQEQLLREAVSEYGSHAEAARWVATADTSRHVSGDAVDIGPADAAAWLSEHGAGYGLCRVYRNEPWHFELRPAAASRGCPQLYADPTHDPRMQ